MSAAWTAGISFLVAGGLAPLLARYAAGRDLVDVPNERSSHDAPTPRLGGLAIILGAWAGVLLTRPENGIPLLLFATLMGLVGLGDDLWGGLHFGLKAALQAVLAGAMVVLLSPPLLDSPFGPVLAVVGVLWVVALTNALNFMDGIDGIIGGVALVSLLFLTPLAGGGILLFPALGAAVAGFLVWNLSPASIFLGDAGSYFLGFFLAASALYAPLQAGLWTPLACVLVFTPLLFDTGYTLLRRLRAGKNVFSAHREHIYQRITAHAGAHRRTSNIYYGASVVSGLSALLVAAGWPAAIAGMGLAACCCAGLLALPRMFGG